MMDYRMGVPKIGRCASCNPVEEEERLVPLACLPVEMEDGCIWVGICQMCLICCLCELDEDAVARAGLEGSK